MPEYIVESLRRLTFPQIWGFIWTRFPSCNSLSCTKIQFVWASKQLSTLLLLKYTFVYQLYSKITTLVESMFWNTFELFIFLLFHYFVIVCYLRQEASFASIFFEVQYYVSHGFSTVKTSKFDPTTYVEFKIQHWEFKI